MKKKYFSKLSRKLVDRAKSKLDSCLIFVCGITCGILAYSVISSLYNTRVFITESKPQNQSIKEKDIPEECPGVQSESAGKAEACEGCPNKQICSNGEAKVEDPAIADIANKLSKIKHKILVLSGKGGVGKSTVSSQIAWMMQEQGIRVGLLDIDICGPSIPLLTGTVNENVHKSLDGWTPVYVRPNFAIMSVGFLISNKDEAVIWRGPKKNGLIKQFLSDVDWGELDVLIIDTPPGTSDEHLSIVTYLKRAKIDGALLVTTPQEAALQDVRKEITFCKKADIPIIGLLENMTDSVFDGFTQSSETLTTGTCFKMEVPYAGKLPLDQNLLKACELGTSITNLDSKSKSIPHLSLIVDKILKNIEFEK